MDKLSSNKVLKSQQTKYKIMDTYLDLMCNKNWDKISVKEICSNANITRGTFYQYFSDVYDLLEQIEGPLLKELTQAYNNNYENSFNSQILCFDKDFDCNPPKQLILWFEFCEKNKKSMKILLSQYGDPYFKTKIKKILNDQVAYMINHDNMPNDGLRHHFTKIFLELHFLTTSSWLNSSDDEFLSINEIINILNTMRVGANYLSYKNNNQ